MQCPVDTASKRALLEMWEEEAAEGHASLPIGKRLMLTCARTRDAALFLSRYIPGSFKRCEVRWYGWRRAIRYTSSRIGWHLNTARKIAVGSANIREFIR